MDIGTIKAIITPTIKSLITPLAITGATFFFWLNSGLGAIAFVLTIIYGYYRMMNERKKYLSDDKAIKDNEE